MSKRRKILTELEIAEMMQNISDIDSETDSDSDSDSDTIIYSDHKESSESCDDEDITDICMPSTSKASTSPWSSTVENLTQLPFKAVPGLKVDDSVAEEIDFFRHYFDDTVMKLITEQTNLYQRSIYPEDASGARSSNYLPVTEEEMFVFFALTILIGIIKKPKIKMYFSTNPMLATPFFNSVMSRDRYVAILRCLHFASSDAKKIGKLQPVLDKIIENFKSAYTPERNISIDESLLLWKGRLGFRQYVPAKRSRYGIKLYKLCESKSGYIYNFIIYTGKDTVLKETLGLYGERVVKSLLEELSGQGYHLYIDRFFMSPSLADELFGLQTNTCGTVMRRRKGMPENFPPPKMKIGEMLVLQKKNMNLTAFKDRREVLVISTMHDAKLLDTGKKDRATSNPIMKPECIVEYNKNMGGIDLSDAVIIQYPSFRKTVKWYKKLFFNIMDMAVFNANILFNKKSKNNLPLLNYRLNLVNQIISQYSSKIPKVNVIPKSAESLNPLRLTERHFPKLCSKETGEKVRRRCFVCSHSRKNPPKRQMSYYECKDCNVGLCVDPCFQIFHTKKEF
ncbi:piggyBac transposable element-derived protein 4-like [Argiope bruennichi]|nr:piggyBac transposable element-derived protein 4-like [Argiope bruennichi]